MVEIGGGGEDGGWRQHVLEQAQKAHKRTLPACYVRKMFLQLSSKTK